MAHLVNEPARLLSNKQVGPRLYLMVLHAPLIASHVRPGQFVHLLVPSMEAHVLRRPFSIYARDTAVGTVEILYQTVGFGTRHMADLSCDGGAFELIGPVGNTWSLSDGDALVEGGEVALRRVLLVGGGVGAAPLHLLAEELVGRGDAVDLVLGAQTADALVCRERYARLLGREPFCATDDGSYGRAGFCTSLVEERLAQGPSTDGGSYDCVCVCGPEPLMKIVADLAREADVACEVSLERRMACGVGACLSCVVDTVDGKRRSCVDGPVFDGRKVVW